MSKIAVASKSLLVALALAAGAFVVATREQSVVELEIDGWCLAYDREQVNFATENPAANRPLPRFLVPSDVPTSSILDAAEATGWTVSFNKWQSGQFMDAPVDGCDATALENGLVRFPPKNFGEDYSANSCPGVSFKEYLLPGASEPLAAAVRIFCDLETIVPNCRMVDFIPTGWQAEITLPKSHIDRWRDASADARVYFDTYLTDCGAEDEP